MLRIITDSASDITLEQAAQMNIRVVPIKIRFSDGDCPQETEADFKLFYDRLQHCEELPVTSQSSPEQYLLHFLDAKECGDDVIVLPISSGLSGSVNGVHIAKEMSDYDRIFVIDSRQAIAGQRMLVEQALKMSEEGCTTEQIVTELELLRDRITITGVIDTLEFLKKGGRIPGSIATLGNMLNIKPVIVLEDSILKTAAKARGYEAGKRFLYNLFEKNPPARNYPIYFLFSSNRQMGEKFMDEMIQRYDLYGFEAKLLPVSGVIGTHVGTNCIGICYVKNA